MVHTACVLFTVCGVAYPCWRYVNGPSKWLFPLLIAVPLYLQTTIKTTQSSTVGFILRSVAFWLPQQGKGRCPCAASHAIAASPRAALVSVLYLCVRACVRCILCTHNMCIICTHMYAYSVCTHACCVECVCMCVCVHVRVSDTIV